MEKKDNKINETIAEENVKLLRIISTISALFLSILLLMKKYSNLVTIQIYIVSVFVILFVIILILSFTTKFVKRNASKVMHILYYFASIAAIYANYIYNDYLQFTMLLSVITLSILIIKEVKKLINYIIVIYPIVLLSIVFINQSLVFKFVTMVEISVVFIIAFYNLNIEEKMKIKIAESDNIIEKIANTDTLTGILNRHMLNNYLIECKENYLKNKENCAVMFIDLDNFKNINDAFGHNVGDDALKLSANKLKASVRQSDNVFRYGGDEFIILFKNINKKELNGFANRIMEQFIEPLEVGVLEVYTSPSIGISLYPDDSNEIENIIRNADAAMYRAKSTGKNTYKFFSKDIDAALKRRAEIESLLRRAVQNNEFTLAYQPQIEISSGVTTGLEALIRWNNKTLGNITPSEFIPIAEETGMIIPIGEWIVKTVCRQSKEWERKGLNTVPIAVNVSGIQLKNSKLIYMLKKYLEEENLSAKRIVVEFTESIIQDTDKSLKIVKELQNIGIKVAIDDFGTGYSSLSLLKDIPIDILKIDSFFIKDIVTNKNTLEIIKLIIEMAKKLNFKIIVEGIEIEEQARIVYENGCNYVQGYFFSKPLNAHDVEQYLK
jgi:diguanylate cyclase (GGDEF)-like protein